MQIQCSLPKLIRRSAWAATWIDYKVVQTFGAIHFLKSVIGTAVPFCQRFLDHAANVGFVEFRGMFQVAMGIMDDTTDAAKRPDAIVI